VDKIKSFAGDIRDSRIALYMENVSTLYAGEKKPSIFDISLKVRYGDFLLLTGPNGAGKTTLIETALGLLKIISGRVLLFGYHIPGEKYKALHFVSYVPQDFMKSPLEPYTVKDVVAMGFASRKRPFEKLSKEERKKVKEVLDMVGVGELINKPIGKLSGGQQQRVTIARALVRDPLLLFLDEPFSSLDPEGREYMSDLFSEINKHGTTIVMVSHDKNYIPHRCNRIVEMMNGKIIRERVKCMKL